MVRYGEKLQKIYVGKAPFPEKCNMDEINPNQGVIIPHHWLMRDSRVYELAQKLWRTAHGEPDLFIQKAYEYVTINIQFMQDKQLFCQNEFVQMPGEVNERGAGDCEDGAQLLVALLWWKGLRVRMAFGDGRGTSHRWPETVYKGEWVALDTSNGENFPITDYSEHGYVPYFYINPFYFQMAQFPYLFFFLP